MTITPDNVLLVMGVCIYFVLLITFCTMWYRGREGYAEERAAEKRRKAHGSHR